MEEDCAQLDGRDEGGEGHLQGDEWAKRNRDADDVLRNPGSRLRVGTRLDKLKSFIISWGS